MSDKMYNLLNIMSMNLWYLINPIVIIVNESSNYRINLRFEKT